MTQTLVVELPSGLYTRIQERAAHANRSVQDELVQLLAASIPPADDVPAEVQQSFAALEMLDNEAVERAARTRLADELAAELESLHLKQQREGLTPPESARCAELVRAYERAMLIRAHAAALLKQRGIDISSLTTAP